MTLGQTLKQERANAKLTQTAVAKALNWKTPRHVSNIESDTKNPSIKTLFRLCRLYGCDIRKFDIFFDVASFSQE